jgi:hypothetical protein
MQPVVKRDKAQIALMLDKSAHKAIKQIALDRETSMNDIIESLVVRFLKGEIK